MAKAPALCWPFALNGSRWTPEGALRSKRGNDLKKTAVKAKGTTLCVFRLESADNPGTAAYIDTERRIENNLERAWGRKGWAVI